MKKLILVIAVLCISAWLWNGTNDTPVPDNLLMMNVEALASGPDGGGGGGNDGGDGYPWDDPIPQICWSNFYVNEQNETFHEYLACGFEPWMGGGGAMRSGILTVCLTGINYKPDPYSMGQCVQASPGGN